jgi:membrane protein implicated in regulation of membrane protease activity
VDQVVVLVVMMMLLLLLLLVMVVVVMVMVMVMVVVLLMCLAMFVYVQVFVLPCFSPVSPLLAFSFLSRRPCSCSPSRKRLLQRNGEGNVACHSQLQGF